MITQLDHYIERIRRTTAHSGRERKPRVIRVLAMGATVALLASLGWDAPAQASIVRHGTLLGSVTAHQVPSAQMASVTPPSWCKPKFDNYIRTQLCWGEESTLYIYDSEGELIGTLQLYMFQAIHLHAIGRDFTENLQIFKVVPSGTIPADLVMYLSGYCASPCTMTIHFPQGSPPALKAQATTAAQVAATRCTG